MPRTRPRLDAAPRLPLADTPVPCTQPQHRQVFDALDNEPRGRGSASPARDQAAEICTGCPVADHCPVKVSPRSRTARRNIRKGI
ncbi:hypothetical protein ABTY63_19740 [Streptomyces solisilvae]|uniref:hypothetical protein n=1 Tax=Streptomyces malaysiensis TaxID=92644 RepID=UPI00332941F6